MTCLRLAAALFLVAGALPCAAADHVLSLYGGLQSAQRSGVTGQDTDGTPLEFDADWQGRALHAPPYWGARYTWWRQDDWGVSLDYTHVKLYADDATLAASGFSDLEFTDGLNVVTLGLQRRFPLASRFTPYLGAGIGLTLPHVETVSPAARTPTFGYQHGGLAAEIRIGASYPITDRWQAFAEYEGTYARLDVDMRGGGDLRSEIFTHALNLGVSFVLPPAWFRAPGRDPAIAPRTPN